MNMVDEKPDIRDTLVAPMNVQVTPERLKIGERLMILQGGPFMLDYN